jgi:cysteine-rich repeat protein
MHMHLVFFQILDRDGFTTGAGGEIIPNGNPQPPLAEEYGWKDTAMVGPNETLRVIVRFENYKGLYAYHCHILEHEDHEMMRQFQTVFCGDAEIDPTEACDDGNALDADGCNPVCEIEEYVELSGTGTGQGGGRVDLIVSGELIRASNTTGLTAAQVVQLLADEINANANLQALGLSAIVVGNRVVTTGDIETVDVRDNGLSDVLALSVQPTQLWWGNVEAATSGYDVVSGTLNDLRSVGGDFSLAGQNCRGNDQATTFLDIAADVPSSNDAFWYLLRSQPGSYDSGGVGQVAPRDAGLTACP